MKSINYKLVCILLAFCMLCFTGCTTIGSNGNKENSTNNGSSQNGNSENVETIVTNAIEDIEIEETSHHFSLVSTEDGQYTFQCQDEDCQEKAVLNVVLEKGTDCIQVNEQSITFSTITEETSYTLSGSFYGNILINIGDNNKFELNLSGLSLTSETETPIYIQSGDKVTISAKKGTENYIYDLRESVSEDGISACIYSLIDLDLQGKGTLYVKSVNNNGIHTKDDLTIKNLTLQVDSIDNSLKGNDGVSIESGTISLISRQGDGIKTTNSHISDKGNQKGDVQILGGSILIYAACDGIDAAHDIQINETEATVSLQIYTDKYSSYSQEVTATSEDFLYVRFTSTTYKYSIEYSNDTDTVWYHSSSYITTSGGMGGMGGMGGGQYYYYKITKPSGYTKMRVFIYSSSQTQGQTENYVAKTDYLTINNNFDTFAVQSRNNSLSYGWTNYTTSQNFGPGGGGGMQEGNSDKGDHSTKGLKASNEILISNGNISIQSYDDAIHTNNDTQLGEEGAYYYGTGNIVISAGTLSLYSNDDGIHADGTLKVQGGTVSVINSYEGLEATNIYLNGGFISIKSSDDGMNATATTGTGITITDGTIYVYAGGDGLDANSKSSYTGFEISGGRTIVISTGNADSSLDTENGYNFTGGYVVAIGKSGGMGSESTKCNNFSSKGTSKTISLTQNNYLVVSDIVKVKMPTAMSSLVVVLGETNASVTSSTSQVDNLDANGVLWCK